MALNKSGVVLLAVTMLAAGLLRPAHAETFSSKVISVVDGDTLTIDHNGAREKVILYGVDAPEIGQEFGEEARKFTDDRCFKKTVTLETTKLDKHGRTIATVLLPDGTNLNQELVKQGLAWWSDKFAPNDTKLKQLQESAKAGHKGLWAAPNPVAPWIWRNGQKSVQATIKAD